MLSSARMRTFAHANGQLERCHLVAVAVGRLVPSSVRRSVGTLVRRYVRWSVGPSILRSRVRKNSLKLEVMQSIIATHSAISLIVVADSTSSSITNMIPWPFSRNHAIMKSCNFNIMQSLHYMLSFNYAIMSLCQPTIMPLSHLDTIRTLLGQVTLVFLHYLQMH